MNRRHFLIQTGALAGVARLSAALTAAQGRPAEELASDDAF
jgi:hypothetical protein